MTTHPKFRNPECDVDATDYDAALAQGLTVSGADNLYGVRGRLAWLAACLRKLGEQPTTVMDYGCGIGATTPAFFAWLGVTSVVGTDSAPRALDVARHAYGSERARFLLFDHYHPHASLDLVYCHLHQTVETGLTRGMKGGRLAHDCLYSNSAKCMSAASTCDESAPHPQLSVVVPFLNEQETLPLLKERLHRLADLPETYEFVFVSDGSTDRSITFIEQWAAEDPRVKLVVFTRNFGHQSAVCAGLEFAQGDYIAIIDADLQDPPELMLEMYRTARAEDLDVVYSVREHRDTSPVKRLAYRSFYRLYSYLSESPVNMDSGDFSVLSRRAVNELLVLPERVRFIRGLRSWLGLRSKAVPTRRPERAAGQPQYSWSKLINLAIRGLISFSTKPLRLATISGVLLCMSALLLALVYVGYWAFGGMHEMLPGFTTLVVLMLFLNGAQFLLVGILGEYVGQIFIEVKQRPVFVVDRTINLPPRSYTTYSDNKSYETALDARIR